MAIALMGGVKKTFMPIAYAVLAFGALVAVLGVVLVYLGNQGTTTISFLGQKLNTSSVGVAAIFLGCVVAGMAVVKIVGIMGKAVDVILHDSTLDAASPPESTKSKGQAAS